ncbi:hypothetical protein ACHAWF_015368 [Thalassiosira exigua]
MFHPMTIIKMLPSWHRALGVDDAFEIEDDDDEKLYDNYVASTTDPGNSLILLALVICASSFILMPILARCRERKRQHQHQNVPSEEDSVDNEYALYQNDILHQSRFCRGPCQTYEDIIYPACVSCVHCDVTSDYDDFEELHVPTSFKRWRTRGMRRKQHANRIMQAIERREQARENRFPEECSVEIVLNYGQESYKNLEEKTQDNDNEVIESTAPPTLKDVLRNWRLFLWTIVKWDNESHRIVQLAVPFTLYAIVDGAADLAILGLIAQYLDTNSAIVYAMVDIITGIGSSFFGGWLEAITSLGSQAYGADNYELLGQYVQASCIVYVLFNLPFLCLGYYFTGEIMILLGFDDAIAAQANNFVCIQIASDIIGGLYEAFGDFLDVTEREVFAMVTGCLELVSRVILVAYFAIRTDADLFTLGLIMLACEVFFFFITVLIPLKRGWLRKFKAGLFQKNSLRNDDVLNNLFKVALPLSVGSLLAYAEWELLTVFAAVLGPAEVATWAMLAFIWDLFESWTEAVGDAAEVRCALQLGKGRPELAKMSAYKSIFFSFMMSLLASTILLVLSPYIPLWLSQDETIQGMLAELFPLVAMGNVTMNMGMTCWTLLGAQGRYNIATLVSLGCSFFITVPLGAAFTIWLRIDLQGLTFAVVVGYIATSLILSTFLLTSDWGKISEKIRNKMDDDSESAVDDASKAETPSLSEAYIAFDIGTAAAPLPSMSGMETKGETNIGAGGACSREMENEGLGLGGGSGSGSGRGGLVKKGEALIPEAVGGGVKGSGASSTEDDVNEQWDVNSQLSQEVVLTNN